MITLIRFQHHFYAPKVTLDAKAVQTKLAVMAGQPHPWIDASDAFTRWLCFANAGMLHRGNLHAFDHALRYLPTSDPIIEIGSFAGLSTNLLTYYKRRHSIASAIFTCDRWDFEGARRGQTIGEGGITFDAYREFVRESFLRNVRFFSGHDLPHTVELDSDEFFEAWRAKACVTDVFGRPARLGGSISFAYIDGAHKYECARRDFENVDCHLVPGGFILFDDSADGSGWEVCRLMDELRSHHRYSVVMQNPNYLFVKQGS